jgi:hypothetical protein
MEGSNRVKTLDDFYNTYLAVIDYLAWGTMLKPFEIGDLKRLVDSIVLSGGIESIDCFCIACLTNQKFW